MKILVPVEDIDFANLQIQFIIDHKWKEPVSIYVLSVIHEVYGRLEKPLKESIHYSEGLAKSVLHKLENGCPGAGLTMSVEEGNAAGIIIKTAKDWSADVIVLGSHGRTGLGKAVLGSVAYEVLAASPCQTIVVSKAKKVEDAEVVSKEKAIEHLRHRETEATELMT